METEDWHYLVRPGSSASSSRETLLLLHGTGGDEQSLIPLAREVAPDAAVLSLRGRSLKEGFPRFFRRFDATTYDQEQIVAESHAIAEFVAKVQAAQLMNNHRFWILGYSNGANIGLATLFFRPSGFAGGVFLRPVMALEEPPKADLRGKRILLLHGESDPYLSYAGRLGTYCIQAGADVTETTVSGGHGLTERDVEHASQFFRESFLQGDSHT